jgi:hypothetical protein
MSKRGRPSVRRGGVSGFWLDTVGPEGEAKFFMVEMKLHALSRMWAQRPARSATSAEWLINADIRQQIERLA